MMKKDKNKYNILCAVSNHQELQKIRDFVKNRAENFGFNELDSNKIVLAVDEACTNLINHAFKKQDGREICVQVEANKSDFIITISDDAEPFDPLEIASPNMQEYFSKFKRGGLGIHLMRLVMDEISYLPSNDTNPRNILRLRKQLP